MTTRSNNRNKDMMKGLPETVLRFDVNGDVVVLERLRAQRVRLVADLALAVLRIELSFERVLRIDKINNL